MDRSTDAQVKCIFRSEINASGLKLKNHPKHIKSTTKMIWSHGSTAGMLGTKNM